jgi:hypothetical protein
MSSFKRRYAILLSKAIVVQITMPGARHADSDLALAEDDSLESDNRACQQASAREAEMPLLRLGGPEVLRLHRGRIHGFKYRVPAMLQPPPPQGFVPVDA